MITEFGNLITEEPAMDEHEELEKIQQEEMKQRAIQADRARLAKVRAIAKQLSDASKWFAENKAQDALTKQFGVTHTFEDNLYDSSDETFDSKLDTATQAGVSIPTMKSTFSSARLSMGCFQTTKKDEESTRQLKVQNQLGAEAEVSGVKKLLANSPEFDTVKYWQGRARTVHYKLSKPWDDAKNRVIPTAKLNVWVKAMSEIQQSHDEALDKFYDKYDEAVQTDQVLYRGLHNPDDYPTKEALKTKFYFDYSFDRLADDERTLLSDEAIEAMDEYYQNEHDVVLAKEREQYRGRMTHLKEEVWKSVRDGLKKVHKQRYQDTDADAIREAVEVLETFNYNDDPVMRRVHDSLTNLFDDEFNMDKLRYNEGYRSDVQDKTTEILNSLPSLD